MRELSEEELKRCQLDILMNLDAFCEENAIKYSLGCGTLLGAIRHKGFIPWDDDIDIYLLRKDYNKLIEQFPLVLNTNYELYSLERDPSYNRAYAIACDNRTIEKEFQDYPLNKGVSIDIFPIDYITDDLRNFESFNRKRKIFQILYSIKVVKLANSRNLVKNMGLLLGKVFLSLISSRFLAMRINKYAQKFNKYPTNSLFDSTMGAYLKRPFKVESFSNTINLPFEDRFFKCMIGYDDVLTANYGDYMTPPPPEKRRSTHNSIAYWKV